MLVLLPPSETKSDAGDGPALELDQLSFPELTRARTRVLKTLLALSVKPRAGAKALGLSTKLAPGELARNVRIPVAGTLPAIECYTGVLYDALAVRDMSVEERARANERIAIGSALFGLVSAGDLIPAYRLSAGTQLPRIGGVAKIWKPTVGPLLAVRSATELIVDLRSGAYQALAPVDDAVQIRVLTEQPDGTRAVVSHFNKATKGEIARLLATAPEPCTTVDDVVTLLRGAGFTVEPSGALALDVLTREMVPAAAGGTGSSTLV